MSQLKVFRRLTTLIPFFLVLALFPFNSSLAVNPCLDCSTLIYDVGNAPYSVFCALLDQDNYPDIVVANSADDSISVLFNDGDGTFDEDQDRYAVGDRPISVFCAPIDDDSYTDIVVANYNSDNIHILWNNGNGVFNSSDTFNVGDGPRSLFCANFDGTNGVDIAVACFESDNIYIGLNNGDGSFPPANWTSYTVRDEPYSLTGASFDITDTDVDLAVIYRDEVDTGFVTILYNDGNGGFGSLSHFGIDTTESWDGSWDICAGDWDQDGNVDLALTAWMCGQKLYVMKNDSSGEFERHELKMGPYDFRSIFSADLDNNSTLELVTGENVLSGHIYIYDWNAEADTFGVVHPIAWTRGSRQLDLFCADVDGDTYSDVIWADTFLNEVCIVKERWSTLEFIRGDANGDGEVTILDWFYLDQYEKGGPPPDPYSAGDVNYDFWINVVDKVYLINYLFRSGPAPPNPPPDSCPPP